MHAKNDSDSLHRAGFAAALGFAVALGLGAPGNADAATFTVGPAGTHGTLQAAIDEAIAVGGNNEIRVARGHFNENVEVLSRPLGTLRISGGWSSDFATTTRDREATVIDAQGQGRPLGLWCTGGSLVLENMTFTGGRSTHPSDEWGGGSGGGLRFLVVDTCRITVRRVVVRGNRAERGESPEAGWAFGGGVLAAVWGEGRFELLGSLIEQNEAVNLAESQALGGGVFLQGVQRGAITVATNEIRGNLAEGAEQAAVGGLYAMALGSSTLDVEDNRVEANRTLSAGLAHVPGAILSAEQESTLTARRNRFIDNRPGGSFQALADSADLARLYLSDSIVAAGAGDGIFLTAHRGGRLDATNLTVAEHPGTGISVHSRDAESSVTLYNSIGFGNGHDMVVAGPGHVDVDAASNLFGVDPDFVDAPGRNYRLRLGSPAIDAGDDHPPGGLGPLDVDRHLRIMGPRVDIGAHEAPSGGGGLCRVDRFGDLSEVPASAPACACFRDDALRSMRCSFTFPDLFLVARIPLPLFPGERLEAEWAIHPWAAYSGEPYQLEAVLVLDGKEMPLGGQGNLKGRLREGKLTSETLLFDAPFAAGVLRTTLHHLPAGGKLPVESLTEILIALDEPAN